MSSRDPDEWGSDSRAESDSQRSWVSESIDISDQGSSESNRGTGTDNQWLSERDQRTETAGQWTSGHPEQPVTAADIDSDWWYLVAGTAGLACVAIALVIGAVVAGIAGSGLADLFLFLFILLFVPLALLGLGSLVAIYYDVKAIRKTDVNWQPSLVGYLILGILLSPLLSALAYTIQRYRYLGWP